MEKFYLVTDGLSYVIFKVNSSIFTEDIAKFHFRKVRHATEWDEFSTTGFVDVTNYSNTQLFIRRFGTHVLINSRTMSTNSIIDLYSFGDTMDVKGYPVLGESGIELLEVIDAMDDNGGFHENYFHVMISDTYPQTWLNRTK